MKKCKMAPNITVSNTDRTQKWSNIMLFHVIMLFYVIMLSHVLGGDMAHNTVSRLVPCPGTSLPLRPDFDLKISHF